MTREDIDRIASEYFDDKESEHEMDEVFDLAKKALEERKENVLDKIREEIAELQLIGYATVDGKREIASRAVMQIIDKYRSEGSGEE